FAGTDGGIFLTTNNGSNWNEVNSGLTSMDIYSMAVMDTVIYAGASGGGLFRSTNNGTQWNSANNGLTNAAVYALAANGVNLFAGTFAGVYCSTNNGVQWNAANAGLTNTSVYAMSVSGAYLCVGTFRGGVWRCPLSEIITSTNELHDALPTDFQLLQNYPNPFNPTTTIRYNLVKVDNLDKVHVSLTIYDLLGREVATLVKEEQSAGRKEVQWNANSFASGVYFYKIEAGNFVTAKKLILLK
ncbi:MAG: T9SS type A sorting domain-containing protein, partial [Bacteroidota bacterium]